MEDKWKAKIPEMALDPWKIEKFVVSKADADIFNMQCLFNRRFNQRIFPGNYTRLLRNGTTWMSDTPAEIRPLQVFQRAMERSFLEHGRVLIHGLGLGLAVQYALEVESVKHIDVVEIDQTVIALVGPFYQEMAAKANKSLNLIHGDALTYKFKPGLRWDIVWHDIWLGICSDNKDSVQRLNRRYGRRCTWQKSWHELY